MPDGSDHIFHVNNEDAYALEQLIEEREELRYKLAKYESQIDLLQNKDNTNNNIEKLSERVNAIDLQNNQYQTQIKFLAEQYEELKKSLLLTENRDK